MSQELTKIVELFRKEIPNWDQLSSEEKVHGIEVLLERSQSVLSNVNNQLDAREYLFLGVLLGVIGNLWANLFQNLLGNYTFFKILLLIIASLLLYIAISSKFVKAARSKLSSDPLTRFFTENSG